MHVPGQKLLAVTHVFGLINERAKQERMAMVKNLNVVRVTVLFCVMIGMHSTNAFASADVRIGLNRSNRSGKNLPPPLSITTAEAGSTTGGDASYTYGIKADGSTGVWRLDNVDVEPGNVKAMDRLFY